MIHQGFKSACPVRPFGVYRNRLQIVLPNQQTRVRSSQFVDIRTKFVHQPAAIPGAVDMLVGVRLEPTNAVAYTMPAQPPGKPSRRIKVFFEPINLITQSLLFPAVAKLRVTAQPVGCMKKAKLRTAAMIPFRDYKSKIHQVSLRVAQTFQTCFERMRALGPRQSAVQRGRSFSRFLRDEKHFALIEKISMNRVQHYLKYLRQEFLSAHLRSQDRARIGLVSE